ncbi:hypothetical protein [Pseudoxanthomonas beigongshangi]
MMVKFFVGQRVLVVRPDKGSAVRGLCVGDEAVILRRSTNNEEFWRIYVHGKVNPFVGESDFPVYPFEIEPAIPSGHTASTESFQELMDRLNTQRVEKVEEVGA